MFEGEMDNKEIIEHLPDWVVREKGHYDWLRKEETCCLTGHRPSKLPWGYDEDCEACKRFKKKLREVFLNAIKYGLKNFLCGMAEGYDMLAAEVLIEIRKFKDIRLVAMVPCQNQAFKWSESQKKRYLQLLKECDDIFVLALGYSPACMNNRNRQMVDLSSVCIACFNQTPGGTRNTLLYAKRQGCKVKIINPDDYKKYIKNN